MSPAPSGFLAGMVTASSRTSSASSPAALMTSGPLTASWSSPPGMARASPSSALSWWDSGTNVGEFDGHSRRVLSCAFKPTRPFRIVTCGEDFLVNIYEGPPFKFKLSQREHSNIANRVWFSPDGTKFISVSSDGKAIIYDGKTGEKIGELSMENGHKGGIYAVSWSSDSKQFLVTKLPKHGRSWRMDMGR